MSLVTVKCDLRKDFCVKRMEESFTRSRDFINLAWMEKLISLITLAMRMAIDQKLTVNLKFLKNTKNLLKVFFQVFDDLPDALSSAVDSQLLKTLLG
jgi:hypothetical protein